MSVRCKNKLFDWGWLYLTFTQLLAQSVLWLLMQRLQSSPGLTFKENKHNLWVSREVEHNKAFCSIMPLTLSLPDYYSRIFCHCLYLPCFILICTVKKSFSLVWWVKFKSLVWGVIIYLFLAYGVSFTSVESKTS